MDQEYVNKQLSGQDNVFQIKEGQGKRIDICKLVLLILSILYLAKCVFAVLGSIIISLYFLISLPFPFIIGLVFLFMSYKTANYRTIKWAKGILLYLIFNYTFGVILLLVCAVPLPFWVYTPLFTFLVVNIAGFIMITFYGSRSSR